jgi:3-carboxy-cis,cis-muconate cycloisomerase
MEKLRARTEAIGYPVLGVVSQLNALCRNGLGEWCHWGATTQDITGYGDGAADSRRAGARRRGPEGAFGSLAALARKYRDTPMAGRSNLQQATPITFGYKMATILAGIERHRERLAQLKSRVLMGEFAGASGTLASLEHGALETQAGLMRELGLAQPLIAWHTVRDTIAETGAFLALVGGSLGKIAMDVKLLMQTEVAEVYEPFAPGRGSSSTMPQKRNPVSCLYIHAAASMVRQHASALAEAMIADHERSTGPWEIEWIALPEAFCLIAGALKQTNFILAGLEVDTARMRANLDTTNGLIVSEAVMMGLAPFLGPRARARSRLRHLPRRNRAEPAAIGAARRESRDHEARGSQEARRAVRSGELPRIVRRHGRPRARQPEGLALPSRSSIQNCPTRSLPKLRCGSSFSELEARGFVDPARGSEHVVRPENHLRIAGGSRERDALVD